MPKTVDNDLPITDCCPGFGSVAKYVAVSTLEAVVRRALDGQDLDQGVRARGDGPPRRLDRRGRRAWSRTTASRSSILFPEIAFDEAKFLARVDALVKQHGYCTVVVSEGCHHPDGKLPRRAGHAGRVRPRAARRRRAGGRQHGQARRSATSSTGRWPTTCSAPRATSPRRPTSSRPTRSARRAVELALKGHNAVMPTIERISRRAVPLQDRRGAARRRRQRREVHAARLHHRRRLRHHRASAGATCAPLIQGEDYPPYNDGLPVYVTLKNVAGARRSWPPFELK